jgi:hypothetical protein
MPALVAGIHVFLAAPSLPSPQAGEGGEGADVDGQDRPGHDSRGTVQYDQIAC